MADDLVIGTRIEFTTNIDKINKDIEKISKKDITLKAVLDTEDAERDLEKLDQDARKLGKAIAANSRLAAEIDKLRASRAEVASIKPTQRTDEQKKQFTELSASIRKYEKLFTKWTDLTSKAARALEVESSSQYRKAEKSYAEALAVNAATPGKISDSEIKELKAQAETLKKQVVKEQNATLSSIYKAVTGGLQDLSQITAIRGVGTSQGNKEVKAAQKEIAKTFNDLFNGAITSFRDKINKVKNLGSDEQKMVKVFNKEYDFYQSLLNDPYDKNIPGNEKLYNEDLSDYQRRIFKSIAELYKLKLDGITKEDIEEIADFGRKVNAENKAKRKAKQAASLKKQDSSVTATVENVEQSVQQASQAQSQAVQAQAQAAQEQQQTAQTIQQQAEQIQEQAVEARKQVEDLVKQEEKKIEIQEPVKQEVKSPVKEPSISQKTIRDSLEKKILDAESAAFRQTNPLRDRFAAPVQTEFAQVKEMLAAFDNKSLYKGQEVSLDQIRKKYEEIIRLVKEYQAAQESSERSAAQQTEQLEKQNAEFNKQYQTLRKQALGGRSPLTGDYKAAAVAELDSLKADIDRYSKYNIPSDNTAAQIQQRFESTKELITLQRQLQNEEKKQQSELNKQSKSMQNNLTKGINSARGILNDPKYQTEEYASGLQKVEASITVAENALLDLQTESKATAEAINAAKTALDGLGNAKSAVTNIEQLSQQIAIAQQELGKLNKIEDSRATQPAQKLQESISSAQALLANGAVGVGMDQLTAKTNELTQTTKEATIARKELDSQIKEEKALVIASKATDSSLQNIAKMKQQWSMMSPLEKAQLDQYEAALNQAKIDGNVAAMQRLNAQFKEFRSNLIIAGKNTGTLFDSFKKAADKFSGWYSVSQIIMSFVNRVKQGIQAVKDIDKAMTDLKKVTDETVQGYNQYRIDASVRSKEMATSLTDYMNATTNFARMGEALEDAQALGEVAVMYKNVGDEVESIDDATNSLISTMEAFKISTKDAIKVVDEANYVGNNFAITSGAIGQILQRSASSMNAGNTSLEKTIALGTAAQTIVQDEEKVGSALSTLSMRLRGSTTELENAGEEVDEYASSTSKMRDEIMALTKFDIMQNDTTYKDIYDILGGIAQRWDDLTDVSRANVAEILFGKMRANVGTAILSNFDIAEEVLTSLTDGTAVGSATKEYNTYLDSIEARQARFESAFQSFSASLVNSDLIKFSYDSGTGILGFLQSITDTFGGLPILIGAAGVALKKFFPQLGSKMPLFGRYPYRQKLVYAGNTMQDYLATAWSERAGANAQRKHLGKGNKKIDNHRYGESLSLMRFHFIGAHSGSAGGRYTGYTLTDCKGLAA